MKRVIINADDFGLNSAVNEAVLDSAENGVLLSATIMANMPGFNEAVTGALKLPKLGIGVHLNLLRDQPLCDPLEVPSIVGAADGKLLGSVLEILKRVLAGKLLQEHIEREFAAQVKQVMGAGIKPTHVDSEKHLHILFPSIGRAAITVAKRFDIPRVRVARERTGQFLGGSKPSQVLKSLFVSARSRSFGKKARAEGLRGADNFIGVAKTGRMNSDALIRILHSLPDGTTEVMTHPAAREFGAGKGLLDRERCAEYRALVDQKVKEAMVESGAVLVNYGEI